MPLCQGALIDAVFLYEVLASPRTHRPTPGTRRNGLPFPADASRASNPPEYEHERCFTCNGRARFWFLCLGGQPCRHMLLIVYVLNIAPYRRRIPTDRPTDGQTVSHRIH
ncbi:hypothetical protein ACQKWADRAFT_296188 [Trichoderma austrokoningii]